jgi:hypothetical protein
MIAYWAVPYLLVAAPPVIVLLSVLIGGCTMTRSASDPAHQTSLHADADGRSGRELIGELDRRQEHDELRRILEAQQ